MLSTARIKRESKEMAERLSDALRREVERSGVDLKELAARVGRGDGYFSHLFKGRITLTAEHIFAVLLAIGVKPADFFGRVYGIEPRRDEEDELDKRVLRIMERYGIQPRVRDDDSGGGEKAR